MSELLRQGSAEGSISLQLKNALFEGNLDQMKDLLERGASADFPYHQTNGGNTPLHLAAYNKWPDRLKILLDSLKDDPQRLKKALESTNENGITPLFEAVSVGRPPYDFAKTNPPADEMIEFKKNFYQRMENMPSIVELLLQYGADSNSQQKGFPGGIKRKISYTVKGWLTEQLKGQKDPKVKKALEDSLKLIQISSILKKTDIKNSYMFENKTR